MTKTVLVVEDDVLIRLDVSDHLRTAGFEVLEASTAQEGIDLLRKEPAVAVVFTDVRMPGELDGLDLAEYVVRNHPKVKVIVTSGHIGRSSLPAHLGQLVEKPYLPAQVVRLIRDTLH